MLAKYFSWVRGLQMNEDPSKNIFSDSIPFDEQLRIHWTVDVKKKKESLLHTSGEYKDDL